MRLSGPLLAAALLAASISAGCRGAKPPPAAVPNKTVSDHFAVKVGGRVVRMQVAVLDAELHRGLMERRDLGPDEGMIFVFDKPQQLSFWMRDTPTPLDVGYFGPDGELAEIYPLLPYDEKPVEARNPRLQFALEMRAGWYRENGVGPGARLDMKALAAALTARGFDPSSFGIGG